MTSVDRIQGLSGSLAVKTPVRVATTASITLSGLQTVDGVALAEGDRVLVKDQATASENGIYDASSGPWPRSKDFDGANDFVQGTQVLVAQGTVNAGQVWKLSTASPVIGGALAFDAVLPGDATSVEYVFPDGTPRSVQNLSARTDPLLGAAGIGAYDPIAPAYLKTQSDINSGLEVSLFRFIDSSKHAGIRAETNADDLLTSFQDAAANAKSIFVPFGKYNVSGTTVVSKDGAVWRGEGISASKVNSTVNNLAIFTINGGLNGVGVEDLQLTRSVTAIGGGDGIRCSSVSIGQSRFKRLLIQNQNNGLALGPTDWSEVERVICTKNQNIGVFVTNTASDGACQWSFDTVLCQMNGAQGFLVQTQAGPSQMTVGTFKKCATFANSGVGMGFVGLVAVPLQGVRIDGGFVGEDGGSEIYLDTYGSQHMIEGVFLELAGRRTTGPTLSTAATGTGCGLEVTGNNGGIIVTGAHANGNSLDGFYLNGEAHSLSNCRATNNGLQLTAGRRNGINSGSGRVNVVGGRYGNTGAGTSQQYGAFVNNGNNLSIVGADLTNNATAAWGATSNVAYVSSVANLPNTLNVGLAPAGAVLVGGGATGDFNAAGTINVAGGLLKNDTAYTNP